MIQAVKADSPGVKDGKLVLRFLDDKNLRYDLALDARAASEAVTCLLRESKHLPGSDLVTDQYPELHEVSFQPAIGPDMTPALVMQIGGIQIAIPLPAQKLAGLRACIDQLEAQSNPVGRMQ